MRDVLENQTARQDGASESQAVTNRRTEAMKNRPAARAAALRVPAGELFSAESSRAQLSVLRGMNALERHRHFLHHCPHLSGKSLTASVRAAVERSDLDVVQDEHRFLWDRAGEKAPLTWEQRLVRQHASPGCRPDAAAMPDPDPGSNSGPGLILRLTLRL